MKYKAEDIRKAKESLEKLLENVDTLYFVIRSVSKSGTRMVDVYAIIKNRAFYISRPVALVCGYPKNLGHPIRFRGVGVGTQSEIASNLGRYLFNNENKFFAETL